MTEIKAEKSRAAPHDTTAKVITPIESGGDVHQEIELMLKTLLDQDNTKSENAWRLWDKYLLTRPEFFNVGTDKGFGKCSSCGAVLKTLTCEYCSIQNSKDRLATFNQQAYHAALEAGSKIGKQQIDSARSEAAPSQVDDEFSLGSVDTVSIIRTIDTLPPDATVRARAVTIKFHTDCSPAEIIAKNLTVDVVGGRPNICVVPDGQASLSSLTATSIYLGENASADMSYLKGNTLYVAPGATANLITGSSFDHVWLADGATLILNGDFNLVSMTVHLTETATFSDRRAGTAQSGRVYTQSEHGERIQGQASRIKSLFTRKPNSSSK